MKRGNFFTTLKLNIATGSFTETINGKLLIEPLNDYGRCFPQLCTTVAYFLDIDFGFLAHYTPLTRILMDPAKTKRQQDNGKGPGLVQLVGVYWFSYGNGNGTNITGESYEEC